MRKLTVALLAVLLVGSVRAEQLVTLQGNLTVLKCDPPNTTFRYTGSSAPGQLFLPGEPVKVKLFFEKGQDEGAAYAIEIQEISMRTPERIEGMEGFTDTAGHAHKISLEGKPVAHALKPAFGQEFEVELPLPQKLGTYALVLTCGGKRQFLATVARLPQPRPYGTIENTPIFGEGAFFNDPNSFMQRAAVYARMGIRGYRGEMSWSEREDGTYDWSRFDKLFEALEANNVKIMLTLGGHPWWSLPFRQPTPGWGWTPQTGGYSGTGDWLCDPKLYPRYGKWIEALCRRYWKDGKSGLWALEHYNEPWEGGGISGWKRDCLEYRKLLILIAENARKVDKRIVIAGTSSIMNTEDKLYSDGSREFDKYIDLFTDHYVAPPCCYGPMVAKAHGKPSMETETWFVGSEYLLPMAMVQFMGSGQLRLAPWHPRVLFEPLPGNRDQYFIPTPIVVASAAFNWFVTGKTFEKIVFHTHLPWVFQFGKDDDKEALLVVYGQLMTIGDEGQKGRLWQQVEGHEGGTITIDNSDGLLQFRDLAGNEVRKGEKTVTLPMSYLPTYITCPKGPVAAAERLKAARIEGKRPVEILPRDFATRINAPGAALNVDVHNCLNRAIAGRLTAKPPGGITLKAAEAALELGAGETKTASFELADAKATEANTYPFVFSFASDAGNADYSEALNVTIAPKGTKKIDGDLGDWADVPGIRLVGEKQKIDLAEFLRRPWLDNTTKLPDGTFAELKMAWDENYLYVAAQVHDPTPQMDKPRIEGRNDDRYFHTAYSDNLPEFKKFLAQFPGRSFAEAPYVYAYSPHGDKPCDGGDLLQIALDVTDGWHDLEPTTDRVPYGFHAVPDTDYEYSLYLVAGNKLAGPNDPNNLDGTYQSELWRLLAPGVPRIHDFPRCPKGERTTGAVKASQHVVRQQGKMRFYEMAIPKEELADLKLAPGATFGFSWQVCNDVGPWVRYGSDKAVVKVNGLSFHPYWLRNLSCGVRWALVE